MATIREVSRRLKMGCPQVQRKCTPLNYPSADIILSILKGLSGIGKDMKKVVPLGLESISIFAL